MRDRLLEYYLPLVYTVARRMLALRRTALDLEDLVGIGSLALFESLQRYDPRRGVPFATFARHRVRGAILDEMRKLRGGRPEGRAARLLRNVSSGGSRVRPAGGDRAPAMAQLREAALDRAAETGSLDLLVDPRGRGSIDDFERREVIAHLTTSLSARERNILNLHYGRGITMREISKRIGLSEPRVCALHASILGRLQSRFKALRHEVFS
ncbi:MAG: sigma-70 family RNA polymerase sigma factor [Planctomycetes bacterium]|nr:sigma-70 family RNA polymerase sigma factor [Planctomycetota bacterium]